MHLFFYSKEPCVLCTLWPFVEIKIEHKCSICSFTQKSRVYFVHPTPFVQASGKINFSISFHSWSRVSALPRRPAAYKAAALLTELTRLTGLFYQK